MVFGSMKTKTDGRFTAGRKRRQKQNPHFWRNAPAVLIVADVTTAPIVSIVPIAPIVSNVPIVSIVPIAPIVSNVKIAKIA